MHKITALLAGLAICCTFAGCNEDSSSAANTSAGTVSSTDEQVSADRLNSDYNGLITDLEAVFRGYYDGIRAADYHATFSAFPDFYKAKLDEEVGELTQDYIDATNEWFMEEYGSDYTISLSFGDIYQLSDESLLTYDQIIKDTYGVDVDLQDAYTVSLNETGSGSLGSNTLTSDWYIFVIDGNYYLYDAYFEEN